MDWPGVNSSMGVELTPSLLQDSGENGTFAGISLLPPTLDLLSYNSLTFLIGLNSHQHPVSLPSQLLWTRATVSQRLGLLRSPCPAQIAPS